MWWAQRAGSMSRFSVNSTALTPCRVQSQGIIRVEIRRLVAAIPPEAGAGEPTLGQEPQSLVHTVLHPTRVVHSAHPAIILNCKVSSHPIVEGSSSSTQTPQQPPAGPHGPARLL